MKQYQTNEDGGFSFEGMSIPNVPGNRHYRQMQEEVANGDAEILPYVPGPAPYDMPSIQDQLDVLFESATLTGAANALKGRVLNRPGKTL